MSAWLSGYLQQPETSEPWLETGSETLYCVIDQVRHPDLLQCLYQLATPVEITHLFQGTPFSELRDVSPLLVRTETGSTSAAQLAALCSTNRSGILLISRDDPEHVLAHARRLLRMHADTCGDSLARYYDPAFWCGLALSISPSKLYGPWERVFTPPANVSDSAWRIWSSVPEIGEPSVGVKYPLMLDRSTLAAVDDMRWWYWVRAHEAEVAGQLANERLPQVFDNLRLLVEHGVEDGRHLEHLLPQLIRYPLRDHAEYMQVLLSELPAFEKVQRLEALHDRNV